MQYWCEYAWLGGDTAAAGVLVTEADGVITEVRVDMACPPGAVRLAGITVPGLANAHSHAFHRALRGRTQVGAGTFWTWRNQMYELAATLTPDRYHQLARAVFGEMAMAGITCVGDFHYLHHDADGVRYADPQAMDTAIAAAAEEAGIRLTLLDTCYLQGGIDTELSAVQRRFADADADAWAARADSVHRRLSGTRVKVGAAVHSVRAVGPQAMEVVGAWAERHGAPVHAHVSEQMGENEQCRAAYGCSPTQLLADHGLLGQRFTAVHFTHVDQQDIALLGGAGASVCLCPTTERDLADGIGAAAAISAGGAKLCFGSDSHAVIDLFEEARATELDQR
ncbi:MAG TPA: formimidoylglutamate deiminase, partial [Ilumatobacteraceae bacterium]|nr:formimidoylglutamate deiminase [Ilumatobacteraceae bacterium]